MAPTTFDFEQTHVSESEESKITSLPTPARVLFASLLSILAIALLSFPNPNVDFVKKCEEIAVRQGQNTSYCSQKYDSKIPPAPYLYTTLEEVWDEPICKGFQSSEPDQWLDPWTGWVLPGLSLLVMTPVAAKAVRRRRVRRGRGQYSENLDRTIDRVVPGKVLEFLGHVKEWIFILGDPASAFCGTLAEMWRDVVLVKSHLSARSGKNVKDRLVARICVLMAQVKYTEDTALAVRFLQGYSGSMPIARDAVRAMVGGRVRLLSTVVLPVVLYTGSAATGYYQAAVSKIGLNDTAHSLAYGIWYLFLLVLAVLSNCSQVHVETIQFTVQMILRRCAEMRFEDGKPHPDQRIHDMQKEAYKALLPNDERLLHIVLHDSFGEPLPLNFTAAEIEVLRKQILRDPFPRIKLECETTKLQIRYVDSLLWKRLLATAESNVDEPGRAEQQSNTFTPNLSHQDLRWYLLAQISAWFSVAIPCAFAAAISYTTPKVAISCRSLNPILYGASTFISAILRPLVFYVGQQQERKPTRPRKALLVILTALHNIFLHINIFLIAWGTIFQITGLYRNCLCKFGLKDSYRYWKGRPGAGKVLTQWNVDTEDHRYWARRAWVPLLVSAWVFAGVMSLAGFLVKEYVVEKVRGHELEWQSAVQKPLRGTASTVMSDQGAVVYGHPTLREDDSDKSGDLLPKEGTAIHI